MEQKKLYVTPEETVVEMKINQALLTNSNEGLARPGFIQEDED